MFSDEADFVPEKRIGGIPLEEVICQLYHIFDNKRFKQCDKEFKKIQELFKRES